MCGIIGFSGYVPEGQWGETHRLLESLFLEAESRGHDATGFVAVQAPVKRQGKRSIAFDRRPLAACHFLRESKAWRALRHRRCTMVLGHTRWATHGEPRKNENNGPQRGKSGLYLAHNGIVGNYLDIAEKYGLTLTSECDSEVILRLAEASPHPADGLRVALRECIGSMAVALYDEKRNVVWLARDSGRPLVVARMVNDRRLFLASTVEILVTAFEKVRGDRPLRWELLVPLAENQVYALSDGKLLVQGACETRSRAELREGLTRGFLDE